jgi:predicted ABC-type transport system involved in lysophospholipase L1 biosynthesis ATPase subunit
MTTLLSIENVSKVYPDGSEVLAVLDCVSFELPAGAQLGLYGAARSGKSTLLRIAAGIERPDCGAVRLEGSDLVRLRGAARARLLRRAIGYIAISDWRPIPGECALDHVATALGSDGFTPREARRKALRVLERVELPSSRRRASVGSLGISERTRLGLARALVREPRLLVVDEPAIMPSITECEQFSQLLRSVAQERSVALLAASSELAALQGLRLMSLSNGELCFTTPSEDDNVVRLPFRNPPVRQPIT